VAVPDQNQTAFFASWDFEYFPEHRGPDELNSIVMKMLKVGAYHLTTFCAKHCRQDFRLLETFGIRLETLEHFLGRVARSYRPVPYHNYTHVRNTVCCSLSSHATPLQAFNVIHVTFMLLRTTRLGQQLSLLDIFALLIASLCHDIDHPGTNNEFQVNSGSDLAFMYNNQSVMLHNCHLNDGDLFESGARASSRGADVGNTSRS
jgi:hypothetical protein